MKTKVKYLSILSSVFAMLLVACVYLDSADINQVQADGSMAPKIKVNEVATFTLKGHMDIKEGSDVDARLVIGMLAPRSWDIRNNATMTFQANRLCDPEDINTMSPIPEGSAPKNMEGYSWSEALMSRFGIGTNLYNDMEWVAWQSDNAFPYFNGSKPDYTVTIKCKMSNDNIIACLGFVVNHTNDGLSTSADHHKVLYTDPFTVYGGNGEVIDFTKQRFNTVEPARILQDDIVTFTFGGDAFDNDLVACSEIFFESIAYTFEGGVYTNNRRENENMLRRDNSHSNSYSVTLWPVQFFDIPEGETIQRIDYVFTNRDGSIVVNKSLSDELNGDTPASDDIPFSFYLQTGV